MDIEVSGGCLCGTVRYRATGTPYNVTHCHCTDCRRSTGAPFVTWASFHRVNFRFTKQQPKDILWAGRIRSFCPECGTLLTFLTQDDADEVDVTVCSLDHPTVVKPADHTWFSERLPWIHIADSCPTHLEAREK